MNAPEDEGKTLGATDDLDDAIATAHQALATTHRDHPGRATLQFTLSRLLAYRFQQFGVANDLDEAIDTTRRAIAATPSDHPDRAAMLSHLSLALAMRFDRASAAGDLDEAIDTTRQAIAARPPDHPDQARYLRALGAALLRRFERTGEPEDLDEAIGIARQAVAGTPPGHPQRAATLGTLGRGLVRRFERSDATGDLAEVVDLDEVIGIARQTIVATPPDHPDQPRYLNVLGSALLRRFEQTGVAGDLDEAIDIARQAVAATSSDESVHLHNLAEVLLRRFKRTDVTGDLDEAIATSRQAVAATTPEHPDQVGLLNALGGALGLRFERTGATSDLDEAVDIARQAVATTPPDHPDQAGHLNTLSGNLLRRFQRTGATSDLDEAVDIARQAVATTPPDHPDQAALLNTLSQALRVRSHRTGATSDINEAVDIARQVIAATPPDHPSRAVRLHTLGVALGLRAERTDATRDLDETVDIARQAVATTPPDHPERAVCLFMLGVALRLRFDRAGAARDLDETIDVCRQAATAVPIDRPVGAHYLYYLGIALWTRSERTGAVDDLRDAIHYLELAVMINGSPPSFFIQAARAAAELIRTSQPHLAAMLMESAVRLLPEVAPRQLRRFDQQHILGEHSYRELACDAAALALADTSLAPTERTAKALQLLELGRAVILGQALQVRGGLNELAARYPDMADEFVRLRDLLDSGSDIFPPVEEPGIVEDRHRLASAFSQVIHRIRQQPGFESFGLAPSIDELAKEAAHGPIVVFNVSRHRSDAIVLTVDAISNVPLPGLAHDAVVEQVNAFYPALTDAHDIDATVTTRQEAQRRISAILAWLWENATSPVLNELGYNHSYQSTDQAPRVWWIPAGMLSLLPIHAAGDHSTRNDPSACTVIDRVVSSYTPTIGALRHARRPQAAAPAGTNPRSLVVGMPTTPGIPDRLRYAAAEAEAVASRLFNVVKLVEPDRTTELPTISTVLRLLVESPIAHFACHGVNDVDDPSRSRLLLHDHETTPFTVATLQPIHLDNARLAYLSACQTATTAAALPDEAIHLTSAFQLAGYPHVIGTLWPISDRVAVDVAIQFYDTLCITTADHVDNVEQAARALHQAIRTTRDRFATTPSLWASYIHAGR